jgi:hypothetical protein
MITSLNGRPKSTETSRPNVDDHFQVKDAAKFKEGLRKRSSVTAGRLPVPPPVDGIDYTGQLPIENLTGATDSPALLHSAFERLGRAARQHLIKSQNIVDNAGDREISIGNYIITGTPRGKITRLETRMPDGSKVGIHRDGPFNDYQIHIGHDILNFESLPSADRHWAMNQFRRAELAIYSPNQNVITQFDPSRAPQDPGPLRFHDPAW